MPLLLVRRLVPLYVVAAGCVLTTGLAQAQGKPGQWMLTVETHTPQTMQAEAEFKKRLQSMTAEQRKRLLGNMEKAGARAGAPETANFPICRTASDARRLALYLPAAFEQRCQPKSVTRSGERSVKAVLSCTGTPKTSGEGEYNFPSDTTMDGRTTLRIEQGKGKRPETVRVEFKGEWQAAACSPQTTSNRPEGRPAAPAAPAKR